MTISTRQLRGESDPDATSRPVPDGEDRRPASPATDRQALLAALIARRRLVDGAERGAAQAAIPRRAAGSDAVLSYQQERLFAMLVSPGADEVEGGLPAVRSVGLVSRFRSQGGQAFLARLVSSTVAERNSSMESIGFSYPTLV